MTRWEYKTYRFESGDKIIDILNKFGSEGWEAFHFSKFDGPTTRVLLKRPIETVTGEPQK